MALIEAFLSASFWGWVLSLFGGIFLCVLVFWALRKLTRKNNPEESEKETSETNWWKEFKRKCGVFFAQYGYLPHDPLSRSFAYAIHTLQNLIGGRGYRYRLPWVMVIGEEGSGKTSLLESLRLPLPTGAPAWNDRSLPCGWWFFDHGVALDVQGRLVLNRASLESSEEEWRLLLNLLSNHRPNRPLDGIVLTVSCTDLLTRSADDLTARADILYSRFWEIQRVLGMKLPVFVVITHTDKIPGFASFCQEIPEENRDDMFGWSNPYPLEMAYTSTWVDEIFQHIGNQLIRLQQEVFTQGKIYTERDGLILFPREFERLYIPLSIYLNHIFKGDNLYENFFLRGLYFSGDSQVSQTEENNALIKNLESSLNVALSPLALSAPTSGTPEMSTVRQDKRTIYFSTALFREKIFIEKGLVRFVRRHFLANSKSLKLSQIAVLLLTGGGMIGLMHSYNQLMDARSLVLPSINRIGYAIQRSLSGQNQTTLDQAFFQQQAALVLHAMADIRSEKLFSIFIPSSWLSPLDARIQKVLTVAYDVVILQAIAYKIREGVEDAISGNLPPILETTKESERINPEQSPAFLHLDQYVKAMSNYQTLIIKYNDLQDTANLQDFGYILESLFGKVLTPDFYQDTKGIYRQALARSRIQPIGFYEYIDKATARLNQLSELFIQQALNPAKLTPQIDRLQKALKDFGNAKASYTVDQLRELVQVLSHTISIFTNPQSRWLEKETFSPGAEFDDLMNKMVSCNFFQASSMEEFVLKCGQTFQEFRSVFLGYRSPITGPLFVLDQNVNTPFVSQALLNLQGFLNLLLAQPFMSAVEAGVIQTTFTPNTTLIWNYALLHDASQLMNSFESFFSSKLTALPADMQEVLRLICLKGLHRTLASKIAQAQQFVPLTTIDAGGVPEEIYMGTVQNLRAVLPLLSQIINGLQQTKSFTVYKNFRDVLDRQGALLLAQIDAIFEADRPYQTDPDEVNKWKGSATQIFPAFGMTNLEQLRSHLGLQRQRMLYLAKEFSEPPLQLLEAVHKNDVHKPVLVSKWRDILTQLSLYNRKSPSTLQALEEFIASEMPQMDLENCPIILGMAKADPTDYFQEKLQTIRNSYSKQCRGENTKASEGAYNKIANYFNAHLAGRYPFAPKGFSTYPDAELQHILGFYALFDAQGPYAEEILRIKMKKNSGVRPALNFMSQIKNLRPFFQPLFSSQAEGALDASIPFEINFRTNQTHEKNGNQIISWTMSVGDETYDFTQKNIKARWIQSTPVTVELRWALGSPYRPVESADQSSLSVGPLSAKFEYKGCWALLRMIEAHKALASDFDQGVDPTPTTLRFNIPTVLKDQKFTQDAACDPSGAARGTKVFMSLKPSSSSDFKLPTFPTHAPSMEEPDTARPSSKKVSPPTGFFPPPPCSAEQNPQQFSCSIIPAIEPIPCPPSSEIKSCDSCEQESCEEECDCSVDNS